MTALKTDGTLWSWGSSSVGQLGTGITTRNSPVQIGTDTDWAFVHSGGSTTLAIKTNGTLWGWGYNNWYQLGLGNVTAKSIPVQIGTATDWASAFVGAYHVLALKTTGALWSWGNNGDGQLGIGNRVDRSTPGQVGTLSNWSMITVKDNLSFAIKTDKTLWFWGYQDSEWMLSGLGTSVSRSSPVQVGVVSTWNQVSVGTQGPLALRDDHSLWSWGRPINGALAVTYQSPIQIGTQTNWADVFAGLGDHVFALRTTGALWAWGCNDDGEIGSGATYAADASPIQIGTLTNWSQLVVGDGFSAALKKDGSVWSWGLNASGQLGDGSTNSRSSPVQVGGSFTWSVISAGTAHLSGVKK